MKLLNVKLDEGDARIAAALRKQGVVLSELVRASLRTEFLRRKTRRTAAGRRALLAEIRARHPVPADCKLPEVDTTDRRAVQAYIRGRLRRGKP